MRDKDRGDAGRAVLRHGPISIHHAWRNREGEGVVCSVRGSQLEPQVG